jgi:GntR family transcriptional regulator
MTSSPIRKASLADQVEQILINRIREGDYSPGERLPNEAHFAEEFDVSRATIRAAFNAMTASRIIVRRHGVGTFVSRAAQLANPLDQSIDFLELISSSGFEAEFEELILRIVTPDDIVRAKLGLEEGQQVLEVHKIFSADGNPVIYSQNYIPEWVYRKALTDEQALVSGSTEPFFAFFRDMCKCELKYYLSDVCVGMPSDYPLIIDPMDVGKNTPILVIDEVGYDNLDRPVNYAIEYLPGNRMQFSLVRKCLDRQQ